MVRLRGDCHTNSPDTTVDNDSVPNAIKRQLRASRRADRSSWIGRRDYMLLHLAAQTGLRLSKIIQLERTAVVLGPGANVGCLGTGHKERCTPLTAQTRDELQAWFKEAGRLGSMKLSPNIHAGDLSAYAVQRLLRRHVATATQACP